MFAFFVRNSLAYHLLAISLPVIAGLALAAPAFAVGGDEEEPTQSNATEGQYQTAKRAIDAGRYTAAVPILQGIVKAEPRNANAWNLLAFANRKMKNYEEAMQYYRTALSLDPRHKGAHEYLGELYLAKGDLASARSMRARLADICGGGCEELEDLDKAIAAHRAGAPGGGS